RESATPSCSWTATCWRASMHPRIARPGNSPRARTTYAREPSPSTAPRHGATSSRSPFGRPEQKEQEEEGQEMFTQIDEIASIRRPAVRRLWETAREKRRELALCIVAAPAAACVVLALVAAL